MLNVMRDNLRHLKWVLWVVAASMVLYLGAFFSCEDPGPGGMRADWAARVGGVAISAAEFRSVARGVDEQYRSTFGDQYDSLRPSLRIGSQVIQDMINSEVVRQDARRLGLSVAPEELAETIRTDPRLQQDGKFIGFDIYAQWLQRSYPGGVQAFERDIADSLIAQKWSELMTQSVRVSDGELEDLHRSRTVKTAVDYVMVASADQDAGDAGDDAALRSWYDAHPEDYRREPGRSIRFVELSRDRYNDQATVSEEEVAASYEAGKSDYTHGDERRASHILLRVAPDATDEQRGETRARAEGILARVQAGEDFETLAQTLSEDPSSAARGGDLGYFERERMVPEFAEACFATAPGEFAPVTETQFGFHVIRVTDARPAGTAPLADVRDEIVLRLKVRRAQQMLANEADRIAAALSAGGTLDGIASAEGLEVRSRFVSRDEPPTDLGVRPEFLDAVFALQVGDTSSPLDSRAGKLIVTVDEEVPAQVAPFDEVVEDVRRDVVAARRHDLALERARTAASGNWTVEGVARKLGLEVQDSGDLSPGAAPSGAGGSNAELEAALFDDAVAVGDRGVVRVPGGALVYEVTHRQPFDPLSFEAARAELLRELESNRASTVRQAIVAKLREQRKIEINQTLIAQIDGLR